MEYKNEEEIRKDFARIFDWYDQNYTYGYPTSKRVLKTPSWAEIFAEVGKLMEKKIIHHRESKKYENIHRTTTGRTLV